MGLTGDSTEAIEPTGGAEAGEIGGGETGESGEAESPSYESIAREKGWRPKEEFQGNEKYWVDAETFVKNQPLVDKIGTQRKKLKELERTVEAMAKHYNETLEQSRKRMIAELTAERREAIELGEVSKVEELDKQLDAVKQTPAAPVVTPVVDSEIEQFVSDQRDWFNKDQEMTDFAVAYNESYLKKHPNDLGKSLEETLKAVKRAFPEKFANQRRSAPPAVEGGTPSGKGNDKYSVARLSPEQKLVYNQLVKMHKQMSHEEYFKSLDEAGFLA